MPEAGTRFEKVKLLDLPLPEFYPAKKVELERLRDFLMQDSNFMLVSGTHMPGSKRTYTTIAIDANSAGARRVFEDLLPLMGTVFDKEQLFKDFTAGLQPEQVQTLMTNLPVPGRKKGY